MVHLGEVCKDQVRVHQYVDPGPGEVCKDQVRASSGPPRWSTWVRYVRIRSGPVVVHLGEVCKDQVRASSGPPG